MPKLYVYVCESVCACTTAATLWHASQREIGSFVAPRFLGPWFPLLSSLSPVSFTRLTKAGLLFLHRPFWVRHYNDGYVGTANESNSQTKELRGVCTATVIADSST